MSVVRFRLEAPNHAGVAQSVEQLICNQQVAGSSPISSSKSTLIENRFFRFIFMDGFPSGQREQTVNLPAPLSVVRIHPRPPRKVQGETQYSFWAFLCIKRDYLFCAFLRITQYLFWNILRIKFINLCRITQKYTDEPGAPKTIDELFAEGNEEYVDIVSDTLNDNLYDKIVSKIIVKNVEDVRDARWEIVSKAMKLRNTLNIYLKIKI